jgi:hypothetical protein
VDAGPQAWCAAPAVCWWCLSVLLAVRVQARRDCVTDVILEGSEELPVAVVQRERRRLLSDRNRVGLARSLEELAREVAAPRTGRVRLVPALCEPRFVCGDC